jgi:transcriptional regulator GlxA family with amidase domain
MRPKTIVILVYDGAQPIDIAGPLQAFATANEEASGEAYRVKVAAVRRGALDLTGGLRVLVETPPSRADTLVVPGGPGVHAAKAAPPQVAAVRKLARHARRVCSVCTGAFLLAEAGLLDNRQAVTHWRSCARLAAEYPNIRVLNDPIWVRDDHIWTSAGVTAGIDLTLALIEEDLGRAIALAVAQELVVFLKRPGGQSQFSQALAAQEAIRPALRELQAWIAGNVDADLSVAALADRAHLSERSFARAFRREMGQTPAAYVEALRIERARVLLEDGAESLETVARATGFRSAEVLRRAFHRHLGVSPAAYRERFRLAA